MKTPTHKIPIIMYHRILKKEDIPLCSSYEEIGSVIEISNFIDQINFLNKKYSIISLNKLVSFIKGEVEIPSNSCVISFDDGYVDHYENAFPVLKDLKIPAVFFMIGDCIAGTKKVRWLDKLYYILDNTPYKKHSTEFNKIVSNFYKTEIKQSDSYTFLKLKTFIRNSPKKYFIIDQLASILNVNLDLDKINKSLYLSKENILEMLEHKMEFGSHTMSHPDLITVTPDDAIREIVNSKKIISNLTGKEQIPFAYPFGGQKTYNKDIIETLKENNFSCSLTSIPGFNSKETPLFELKRMDAINLDIN